MFALFVAYMFLLYTFERSHRWLLPANKDLDDLAQSRYDALESKEPSQWPKPSDPVPDTPQLLPSKARGTKSKKKKIKFVPLPAGRAVYVLIDVETTGYKRNWDRGIKYAVIACDNKGKLLGTFCKRVNNDGVRIKPSAYAVHGISADDRIHAPKFSVVGAELKEFFQTHLEFHDAGVFVAHR